MSQSQILCAKEINTIFFWLTISDFKVGKRDYIFSFPTLENITLLYHPHIYNADKLKTIIFYKRFFLFVNEFIPLLLKRTPFSSKYALIARI